jgi:FXSXX-COOH protein
MEDNSLESARSSTQSPIIDCSGLSLDKLAKLDDSVLVQSLNRILGDVDNPDEVVFAGFNASV